MDKVKVLHVMNGAINGGISMTVLNIYKCTDREHVHFDCAVYDDNLGINGKSLQDMGCEFYKLPLKSKHPLSYAIKLSKIIKKGNYNVLHVHYNDSSFFPLIIGHMCGIKKLIAHAHTYREIKTLHGKLKLIFRQALIKMTATLRIACSEKAAISIFGKKEDNNIVILKNAVDTDKFKYNETEREKIRNQLNLCGNFLIGCVGNLGKEKNISFAIEIFADVLQINKEARLIIVGDGPEKKNLINLARRYGIIENVLFLGRRSDVNIILQGLDVFIMPSLFEGFGIAALEAATSGLPIILSDKIPNDFEFYPKAKYISLNDSKDIWVQSILEDTSNFDRTIAKKIISDAGFDFQNNKKIIKRIYEEN